MYDKLVKKLNGIVILLKKLITTQNFEEMKRNYLTMINKFLNS